MIYKILILLGFIFSSLALSSDAYLESVEFDVIFRLSQALDGVCLPNRFCLKKMAIRCSTLHPNLCHIAKTALRSGAVVQASLG